MAPGLGRRSGGSDEFRHRPVFRYLSSGARQQIESGGCVEGRLMNRDELRENLMVAVDTLRANKGRSMLTILGIVIGVTSVIAVAAIITGLNRFVQMRVEKLGSRTFFLMRINMMTRFGKLPEAMRKRKYLEYGDSDYLRSVCPSFESVSPFNTRIVFLGQNNDIRDGSERVERIFLRGAGPAF